MERYWSPTNSPVLGTDRAVVYVIHHVEDVTELVRLRLSREPDAADGADPVAAEELRPEAETIASRVEVATLHTQLIDATRQAQQSEQTLRAFIDLVPAVISIRDTSGRLVLRNRLFETRFRRPDDSGTEPGGAVLTPELTAWLAGLEREVIRTGAPVSSETTVAGTDGTVTVYEFTKFPLRTPEGEVRGVGTIATDVTKARAAHAALAASDELFRQMAENVDEVFMLWEEGTFATLYVSPSVERILGLDVAHFHDRVNRIDVVVHPDDLAVTVTPPAPQKEFRIVRPNGDVRWIRSRTSMVETAEGLPDRGVTTLTDVTEQKTAELAAEAARADAEAANQAKSDFLSRMSHELRTPLNAILGFGQLLEMGELRDEQSDGLAQIRRAGQHLLGLIDAVLDIAGAETGDLRLSLEPVSIRDVANEAVAMIRPLADRRRLTVVMDQVELDAYVTADRQRLRQVLLNLLANAVKYNREGGEVRIDLNGLTGPDRVRLTVSDTGLGIDEGALARLFRPFERLSAEKSEIEGTGLGLALAKQLTTAMSGQIGVTSRVGEGSSFWVELPTTSSPVGDRRLRTRRQRTRRVVDRPPPGPAGNRTLLYVEDNPSNVRLLERLVERRPGVELVVAMQAGLGLELALERRPDLILLDPHLPDMSGEELLRILRADPRTARTPIIVLSADASPKTSALVLAAGATELITKPFDVSHLLGAIDAILAVPRTPPGVDSP